MFIPSLTEIKLAVIAAGLVGAFVGGIGLEHKIAEGRYERLVAAQATANLAATNASIAEQKRLDGIALSAAKQEAAAQAAGAALAKRQLAQVQKHVTDLRTRVPLGVVRLLDGAARGLLPDALVLPAGKSDGALSALGYTDLARSIVGNYGTCRANGEQLDALIGAFRASKK